MKRLYRILLSPFTWILLSLLFYCELNSELLPIEAVAISQKTLPHPQMWHTVLTAGFTHRNVYHLLINLLLLIGLAFLFRERIFANACPAFIKLVLVINVLHRLALATLIQGASFPTYIYGASGIVCGIAAFIKRSYSSQRSIAFKTLSWSILVVIMFSFLDISLLNSSSLSSYSHLLGFLMGVFLSMTPFLRKELS